MSRIATRPPLQPDILRRRLAGLRRRMRSVVTLRGLGWLLAIVLGAFLAAGALDWRFHLPSVVRAVVLIGTLGGAGYVAYRHLFLPLRIPADDLSLALRVEERYATLNDSLASTVEFLEQADDSEQHGSPTLRREAVRRALRRIEGYDFGRVIDRRGLPGAVLGAVVCGALAVIVSVLFPGTARTAFLRLAVPFGGPEWPLLTQLEIDPPREAIGRNEPLKVSGRIRGVIPAQATITFQSDGASSQDRTFDVLRDEADGTGTLAETLPAGQAQRRIRFQVRANDARSGWYEVAVLPPPQLVPLDGRPSPQVRLEPPAYTDLSPTDLSDGTGVIDAIAGTLVQVRAAADRPLARAWIEYDEPRFLKVAAFLGALGASHPVEAGALAVAGQAVWGVIPARLGEDRQTFALSFLPRVNGKYLLHFVDDSSLPNSWPFEVRVQADPSPTVNLERPARSRDFRHVLPDAELPLLAQVEDPQFAIRSVWLEYRLRPAGQPVQAAVAPPFRLTLYDHQIAGEIAGILVSGLAPPGQDPMPVVPIRLREKRLEINRRLALARLPGVKLREGGVLTLQICADDFDNVSVDKQPGRSTEFELQIVGRNAFDLILNHEQSRLQQELVRLRLQEREAIRKVAEAQAAVKKTGRLDAEAAARVSEAERLQAQIQERIGPRQLEGLRGEVQRVREALENNHLPRSATHDRMEMVGSQLDRLAREELEPIASRLNSVLKPGETPEQKAREKQRLAEELERLAEEREKASRKAEQEARDAGQADAKELKALAQLLREQAERLKQAAQALREGREQPAEQRDRQARTLEGMAQEKEQAAARLEEIAGRRPESDAIRQAAEAEAKRQRQQAQELRQAAGLLRQGKSEEDSRKELLAEARRHQEEVDKTLTDMLARLDPFASTVEIKGEAKAILQEQRRLGQETQDLQKRDRELLGRSPEQLTPPQKAELEKLGDEQQRLENRLNQLIGKMGKVRQAREEANDPQTAEELRSALESAEKSQIGAQMNAARKAILQNQLGTAGAGQQKTVEGLEKLVKELEDRREAELDRLSKKLREVQKELEKLAEEQERLQKKVKEAAQIADPQKRAEELKKLAREQQQLQQRTHQAAEQLSRMQMGRAAQEMAKAAGQMEDALKQLERGQPPEENHEEALDRLDEARRELEQAREEVEEELAREQLAKVADIIKRLKERQEGHVAEAARIQRDLAQREPGLWRGLLISLGDLSKHQKDLGQETANLADDKLAGAQVFARTLHRAAKAMSQAGDRLFQHREQVKDKGKPETPDGAEALRLQQEALRRLEQLLEAVKQEPGQRLRPAGGGGGGGGQGGKPPGDGIPALAQLKLLRALQADVNQRTDEFQKKHPDPVKLGKEQQAELESIRKEQREVADLLDELTRPADPEGAKP